MARRTGGAGRYKRRDLKKTEHLAQKGAKPKRKPVNRKPKGTLTKAGAAARGRKPSAAAKKQGARGTGGRRADGTKRGQDRYGVGLYKKGTAKRKTGGKQGSRVMRGKADTDAMYVYDRKLGSYKKVTKAAVKKMETSGGGVGSKSTSRYRLVTKRTFEDAKKQGYTKKKTTGTASKPKQVRQAAGRRSRSTSSPKPATKPRKPLTTKQKKRNARSKY